MMLLVSPALANVPQCYDAGETYLHGGSNPYTECSIPPGEIKVSVKCNSDGDEGTEQKVAWYGDGSCQFVFNGGTCNSKTKDFTYNPPVYGQPDTCTGESTQYVKWVYNGSSNGSLAIRWEKI